MQKQEIIRVFTEVVNNGGQPDGVGESDLVVALREAHQAAQTPTVFFNERLTGSGLTLDQSHKLLTLILDPAVVDQPAFYQERLDDPEIAKTFVMLRRWWTTVGPCSYDDDGHLTHFAYDPLTVSQHIAATVAGDYIALDTVGRDGVGIGAIGQLAVRKGMQRARGHGSTLSQAFEAECQTIATARGEKLCLMFLEAEAEAIAFWVKQGYRYPAGSQYFQPPIAYDPDTGERLFDEVLEMLMIKVLDQPDANSIDSQLLRDVVRAVYLTWYTPEDLTDATKAHIDALYQHFEQSISVHGQKVPLIFPPDSAH